MSKMICNIQRFDPKFQSVAIRRKRIRHEPNAFLRSKNKIILISHSYQAVKRPCPFLAVPGLNAKGYVKIMFEYQIELSKIYIIAEDCRVLSLNTMARNGQERFRDRPSRYFFILWLPSTRTNNNHSIDSNLKVKDTIYFYEINSFSKCIKFSFQL